MDTLLMKSPKTQVDERTIEISEKIINLYSFKSEREFLRGMGFNQSLISKIRQGIQSAPQDFISALGNKYNINTNFIYQGIGDIFQGEDQNNAKKIGEPVGEHYIDLPFVPIIARAGFVEMCSDAVKIEQLDTFRVLDANNDVPRNAIVIEIGGDSMEPQLRSGMKVLATLVKPEDWAYMPSGVYAISYAHNFVVKRVINNTLFKDAILELHSDNPRGGTVPVKGETLHCIYKVQEIVRGLVE